MRNFYTFEFFRTNVSHRTFIARARQLLDVEAPEDAPDTASDDQDCEAQTCTQPCPNCGGRMVVIETFEPGVRPRADRTMGFKSCIECGIIIP